MVAGGDDAKDDNAALKNNSRPIPMMMESRIGFFIIFGKYITANLHLGISLHVLTYIFAV